MKQLSRFTVLVLLVSFFVVSCDGPATPHPQKNIDLIFRKDANVNNIKIDNKSIGNSLFSITLSTGPHTFSFDYSTSSYSKTIDILATYIGINFKDTGVIEFTEAK